MLKNYLIITLRNLSRDKLYAVINIISLSIGVTGFLLVSLYLMQQLSFDRHNEQLDKIFRVNMEVSRDGTEGLWAITPEHFATLALKDYPQIEQMVRFHRLSVDPVLFQHQASAFYEEGVYVADNSVFSMFTHEILLGNSENALSEPQTMAVSASFALRYFGDINPIGQTVSSGGSDYRITLVFEDLPGNTHLKYDALIAYAGAFVSEYSAPSLWSQSYYTYIIFNENYATSNFHEISDDFYANHMEDFSNRRGLGNIDINFYIEPLGRIHFYSNAQEDQPRGNIFYLYAFAVVGLFLLIVACINYVNLATARSTKNLKQVGIRKILGAERKSLIYQYLGESFFFSFSAVVIGASLAELLSTVLSTSLFQGENLSLNLLTDPLAAAGLVTLALLIGFCSGLYPAFSVTSSSVAASLRGNDKKSNSRFRQFLVLTQFTVSVAVISCTMLMYLQMEYIHSRDLGFEKDNRLILNVRGGDNVENTPRFIQQLKELDGISNASMSWLGVPGGTTSYRDTNVIDDSGETKNLGVYYTRADYNYLNTLGIDLVEGRNFDENISTDSSRSVLINETMARVLEWENPVGRIVKGRSVDMAVVGVVRDYHFQQLHSEIGPLLIAFDNHDYLKDMSDSRKKAENRQLIIELSSAADTSVLENIEEGWRAFDPVHPFEYQYLDVSLNQLYDSGQQQMTSIAVFSVICIFISCLGLFGLTTFTTEQRTKEIGIRKVLGASTPNILVMLFRTISLIILSASVIATVISIWAMNRWLESFYYHSEIDILVFFAAFFMALVIAFVVIALQSFRAAVRNPVMALRFE